MIWPGYGSVAAGSRSEMCLTGCTWMPDVNLSRYAYGVLSLASAKISNGPYRLWSNFLEGSVDRVFLVRNQTMLLEIDYAHRVRLRNQHHLADAS